MVTLVAESTLFTVEQATSLLLAQLVLDDPNVEEPNLDNGKESRRDKVDTLTSDAELALKTQAEDLVNAVQVIEDAQLARELEEGFRDDQRYLIVFPSTSHHREIALAVLKRSGLLVLPDSQPNEPSSSVILESGLGPGQEYAERCFETSLALIIDRTYHLIQDAMCGMRGLY
jgi:hypothetical protein